MASSLVGGQLVLEVEGDGSLPARDAGDDVLFAFAGSQANVSVDGVAPEEGHPAGATHPTLTGRVDVEARA